jgi:hypothetical protein
VPEIDGYNDDWAVRCATENRLKPEDKVSLAAATAALWLNGSIVTFVVHTHWEFKSMFNTARLAAFCVVLAAVVVLPSFLRAQDSKQDPNTSPDHKYHLAIAKTHTVHANDNALLLKKYAAGHKTVPDDVIKEHTGAMKYHLNAARKAYASLAKTAKGDGDAKKQADLAKELSTIDSRLAKINDMVKKLETQTTAADQVAAESAKISAELANSRAATQAVDNNFYNMSSSDYYEDGLGHFTD